MQEGYGSIESNGEPQPSPSMRSELEGEKAGLTSASRARSPSVDSAVRDQWASKLEFLLAVIGFAVDLGNVWRFPYVCYRNGGGAFLIPYLVMFIFGGLPLFYMELALGQYHRAGCISIWKSICPLFKGIGFAICFIATYIAIFYNTIIAWAVYFLIRSFQAEVPWKTCGNPWNTPDCIEPENINTTMFLLDYNTTNRTFTSPAEEFFLREVLEIDKAPRGFEGMGPIKWSLALCLLSVFVVVYFALWKGPRSSGKAVWITATMPYIVLFILLIRGVTLPGAGIGIRYYLTPQWGRLLETKVWIDAATQIFFSLGPGFGVLMALASYNDFNNNCYKDAIVTSIVNCLTSFLSGFVIFSTLGYMSIVQNKKVEEVAGEGGPGLIFVVYPAAIATMKGSWFWAILFFFMLITLGIDSTFGGLEAVITAFCDEFPIAIGRRRELFVLALVTYCYIGSLATTTYGGNYLVQFLDHYGVSFSILFIVVVETIAVCWCYGVRRFTENVKEMLGFVPGRLWRICWSAICPVFIIVIFAFACADKKPLTAEGYTYPAWSIAVGWILTMSSLIWIPIFFVYKLISLPGTFMEKLKLGMTPEPKRVRQPKEVSKGELYAESIPVAELETPTQLAQPFSTLNQAWFRTDHSSVGY